MEASEKKRSLRLTAVIAPLQPNANPTLTLTLATFISKLSGLLCLLLNVMKIEEWGVGGVGCDVVWCGVVVVLKY